METPAEKFQVEEQERYLSVRLHTVEGGQFVGQHRAQSGQLGDVRAERRGLDPQYAEPLAAHGHRYIERVRVGRRLLLVERVPGGSAGSGAEFV